MLLALDRTVCVKKPQSFGGVFESLGFPICIVPHAWVLAYKGMASDDGSVLYVGTLKDGYVRNVPLPRVPQRQSASHMTSHELIAPKTGIPIPGYVPVHSWIPTLPKLGSILGFSQRVL